MRRIVLIGDFQVHAIAGLFQRFVVPRTGDRLCYIPFRSRSEGAAQAELRQADLRVEQVDTIPLPPADTGCPVVPLPRVSAPFLWPFAGQPHPHNAPHPNLPAGPYGGEASDRYLNALIAGQIPPAEALDRYLTLDVAREVDLDGLREATLARQRTRDAASGYRIADTIEQYFRREPVFRSPSHPNARIARLLAAQLFHRLGARPDDIARMAQATTRAPFPREELPVHPAVARHFGLRWTGPQRRYRLLNEGDFTFREFVQRYLQAAWNPALEEGLALARTDDLPAAEARLRDALVRSPASAEGHNALRHVLERQGRTEEALAAGAQAVAADPAFGAYRVELANLQRRAGRMAEAEAGYRAAVALDPANAHALGLLARLLAHLGRHEEAAAAVTDALEVEPYAPGLRGMLGVRKGVAGEPARDESTSASPRNEGASGSAISSPNKNDFLSERGIVADQPENTQSPEDAMTNAKALRDMRTANAMGALYWKQPAPLIIDKLPDYESKLVPLYSAAADRIGRDTAITYLEFGVAQGLSMSHMSRLFPNPATRLFGFDSFVGLPEDWLMHRRGAFTNHGNAPSVHDPRVEFVKGWFQNTVPGFLADLKTSSEAVFLIHFDADLYSSTLFLLSMLWTKIPRYYFLFDDFIYDECVALHDFSSAFPVSIEFLAQTRGGGTGRPNPDQVFGLLERTEFVLDEGSFAPTPSADSAEGSA